MSHERREFGQDQPWPPKKDFYLSNPRSAQIREVGITTLLKLNALLSDSKVAHDQDRQAQLYAGLEMLNGQLIELGIEPNIHADKSKETLLSDPVVMAEYVAGQLCVIIGNNVTSETATMPIIEEVNEDPNEPVGIISSKNITPKLEDFIMMSSMIGAGYSFFDVEPEGKPHEEGSNLVD